MGIGDILDLLCVIPKGFLEIPQNPPIHELDEGDWVAMSGSIVQSRYVRFGRTKRFEAMIENEQGCLSLLFFNAQYINRKMFFEPGCKLTVQGKVQVYGAKHQLVHPRYGLGDKSADWSGIRPQYPDSKNLRAKELEKRLPPLLLQYKDVLPKEYLGPSLLSKHDMLPLDQVFFPMHMPIQMDQGETLSDRQRDFDRALKRLALEELIAFENQLVKKKRKEQKKRAVSLKKAPHFRGEDRFTTLFKFNPTSAQNRVSEEISRDLEKPHPMTRLLQGDVGSGKTAVAAVAIKQAMDAGYQAVLMAPTQILAAQHFETLSIAFKGKGRGKDRTISLITASLKKAERDEALEFIQSGETKLIIGTHALLSEGVDFHNLGLIVIDEQQRFGVKQRSQLQDNFTRDGIVPHLLVMSATPIPRSLALTLYGDLDLSILDEMPVGRKSIDTHILKGETEELLIKCCNKVLSAGEKAFVIYPLIEESEKIDLSHAKGGFDILSANFGSRVGIIHGRMKANEKDAAYKQFKDGSIQLLVSTTVVEVGVDVSDATTMIVTHPERFGLSQLHQLRGRVGRGTKKSRCYLLANQKGYSGITQERMEAIRDYQDGFQIAEADLRLRGPGDFLGTKQSGLPTFRFFNWGDHIPLIEVAKAITSMQKSRLTA